MGQSGPIDGSPTLVTQATICACCIHLQSVFPLHTHTHALFFPDTLKGE
jgi:hypothetical protein